MERRKLGRSGIEVSVMALGCWPFAGGVVWGEQDDDASIATVHAALEAGINFFDTAEGYEAGKSEEVLGRALVGRRHRAVIATKVSPDHLAPADLIASCERSLRTLGTDYVDLYMIHWPSREVRLAETVRALEQLQQQGKIRAIGVSNFGVGDLSDMVALTRCASDQLPYGLLWRVIEREIVPLCRREEVGIMCYSPLAQGLLTGRYRSADEVPDGLARTRHYASTRPLAKHGEPGCEAEVFEAIAAVRAIAEELDQSMAAVALAWVRQQPGVTSFLVGARSPAELAWNLPSLQLALSDEVLVRLEAATDGVKARLGTNPDPWMSPSRYR
jgi:aryl-alcohol dehydrogenase-like predicted oxidoreductase